MLSLAVKFHFELVSPQTQFVSNTELNIYTDYSNQFQQVSVEFDWLTREKILPLSTNLVSKW